MLTRGRSRNQVERTCLEPVVRTRQRADWADLNGVAGEVGIERLILGGSHLLLGTAFEQFDEGSPAISSANRVQRAQETQRSRSSRIWAETLIGLGKVRLTPSNRDSACPAVIAWFCNGHSPPLSQTGSRVGG